MPSYDKKVQILSDVVYASRTHGLTQRLWKNFRQKVSSSFLAKESPINLGWVQAGVVIVYLLRTNSSLCVFSRVPEVSWKVQFHSTTAWEEGWSILTSHLTTCRFDRFTSNVQIIRATQQNICQRQRQDISEKYNSIPLLFFQFYSDIH